jgi:ParB/RepB/Spo0J family partition protein
MGGTMEETQTLIIEGAPMAKGTKVEIRKMSLNEIKLNKNSRLNIDPEELSGLMQSIKEEGLLQPIGVVKNGSGYEICYGNRRFLAVSKLGMKTIPVIVHEKKKETDVDIKNLTENIQRRNITLAEIGRYVELMSQQGLTPGEAAVRIGVPKSYIEACVAAFQKVPKEFRDDLEVRVGPKAGTKATAGKISLRVAQSIISAQKQNKINSAQSKQLFRAAKEDERFRPEQIPNYINAIHKNKKDFMGSAATTKEIRIKILVSQEHYEDLERKFVADGPFKSVSQLCVAILKGQKSVALKVLK